MLDSKQGFEPCPDRVLVVGGGRWARVLTEVLCSIVSPGVNISVLTPHNSRAMLIWASERGLSERIHVLHEWPELSTCAMIVVNAARDHEKAVERAVSSAVPVLVEKPIALSAHAAHRLADMSRSRGGRFAAAHIFLFTGYLENFARVVAKAGVIQSLRVRWMDPPHENRYGEQKRYDPGLTIFADWLPHVLSMLGTLVHDSPQRCTKLEFHRGGAHIGLGFELGHIPCDVELIRNGDRRQRVIEVIVNKEKIRLDFSDEPGTISCGSEIIDADPYWKTKHRPSAKMLMAFLGWAAGGQFDRRLAVEIGLRTSEVIDEVLPLYREAQVLWLIDKLTASPVEIDEDVRYSLSEILQAGGPLPGGELEERIERIRRYFSGGADPCWLAKLAKTQDPSMIVKAIAM